MGWQAREYLARPTTRGHTFVKRVQGTESLGPGSVTAEMSTTQTNGTYYYVCRGCRARTRTIFDGYCRDCRPGRMRFASWLKRRAGS
jgi:hypothetical protein